MKKQVSEKNSIEIFKKVEFEFGHLDNAQRVAMALSMAGFYVKITTNQSAYIVSIFTDREA